MKAVIEVLVEISVIADIYPSHDIGVSLFTQGKRKLEKEFLWNQ
jgi:hypothetical protein